jgi:hypothetical protein
MATRKNLQINKKRKHLRNHGYIKGVTKGAVDPRLGGEERAAIKNYAEIKKKIAKDITSVPVSTVKLAAERATRAEEKLKKLKNIKDEATVKKQMAKDEAGEKARQNKLAEERKKKPEPKKKPTPRRFRVAINRRKARK